MNKSCPSALIHGYVMEYYFAINRDPVLIRAAMWMNLRNIILSGKSEMKRLHLIGFHLYEMCR